MHLGLVGATNIDGRICLQLVTASDARSTRSRASNALRVDGLASWVGCLVGSGLWAGSRWVTARVASDCRLAHL